MQFCVCRVVSYLSVSSHNNHDNQMPIFLKNEALNQNDWIKELAFHLRTKVQIKSEAGLSEPAI